MAFKETFETIKESEKEIQRLLTFLKEHSFKSKKHVDNLKYIKAYKEEFALEKQLKLLADFLEEEKQQAEEELKVFKKEIASECLNIKCKQIDNKIQNEFAVDEDFGEED